jgi:hypothetical protein
LFTIGAAPVSDNLLLVNESLISRWNLTAVGNRLGREFLISDTNPFALLKWQL